LKTSLSKNSLSKNSLSKNSLSKNSAIFLAIMLVAGTISIMIPTTFGQSYKDPYAKDQKKKSSDVNFQKVKCNNIIINGVDSVGHGPAGDMINDMSEEDDRISQDSQWFDNDKKKWSDIDTMNRNVTITPAKYSRSRKLKVSKGLLSMIAALPRRNRIRSLRDCQDTVERFEVSEWDKWIRI